MRNATIATSRTRAAADQLIDYRPPPAAWGDLNTLHEMRAEKARAAARGLDPSTLELTAEPLHPSPLSAMTHRERRGLLASLLRAPELHHGPRHGGGHPATA